MEDCSSLILGCTSTEGHLENSVCRQFLDFLWAVRESICVYEQFLNWCGDGDRSVGFEIELYVDCRYTILGHCAYCLGTLFNFWQRMVIKAPRILDYGWLVRKRYADSQALFCLPRLSHDSCYLSSRIETWTRSVKGQLRQYRLHACMCSAACVRPQKGSKCCVVAFLAVFSPHMSSWGAVLL